MFIALAGADATGKSTLHTGLLRVLLDEHDAIVVDRDDLDALPVDSDTRARLSTLREMIWKYPRESPYVEWSDGHWLHMQLAWFSLVDAMVVRPALESGKVVYTETWYSKIRARFEVANGLWSAEELDQYFRHLSRPTRTYLLEAQPETALSRRSDFLPSESGSFAGLGSSEESFIRYQRETAERIRAIVAGPSTLTVSTDDLDPQEVLEAVVLDLQQVRRGS